MVSVPGRRTSGRCLFLFTPYKIYIYHNEKIICLLHSAESLISCESEELQVLQIFGKEDTGNSLEWIYIEKAEGKKQGRKKEVISDDTLSNQVSLFRNSEHYLKEHAW